MTPQHDEAREDDRVISELAAVLEALWSGGGGDNGVYTIAVQREKLRPALRDFMNRCRQPE